jgi:quercetin dioxygenase-like cupin family protein
MTPSYPPLSNDAMHQRIVRFPDLQGQGTPLMFIDSIIPGHHRMNYAVVGDTASENPDFRPALTSPHRFQIGMVMAPPGNGPAYHTHDYIEAFMPLSGQWRFYWGNDPEGDPEGETILDLWDWISLPPGLWRGFENVSQDDAWILAVLEPHDVFASKDPYWSQRVMDEAARHGFQADDQGRMVKPDNYAALNRQMTDVLLRRHQG